MAFDLLVDAHGFRYAVAPVLILYLSASRLTQRPYLRSDRAQVISHTHIEINRKNSTVSDQTVLRIRFSCLLLWSVALYSFLTPCSALKSWCVCVYGGPRVSVADGQPSGKMFLDRPNALAS